MSYEEETEMKPFTPDMEAAVLQFILDRAPSELAQLFEAKSDEEAFTHLPTAAAAAFHLERFTEAKQLAERALALAPAFQDDWNYGNAIHLGHTVLGLIALNNHDSMSAIKELYASGQTLGSPQLNSFGPTMQLAKALLKAGHIEPVIAYLNQCRKFWERGEAWIDVWESKIKEGHVPNFFQHSFV